MPNMQAPEQQTQTSRFGGFVSNVATYFMDFLETNFHKRRIPKRTIKHRNDSGLLLGLNLQKYPSFNSKIWSSIKKSFGKESELRVKKTKYTTQIPPNLLDLIDKQVGTINDEQTQQILVLISERLSQAVNRYENEVDLALAKSLDDTAMLVKECFVDPFLTKIEKPLENQREASIDSIFSIEEGLIELLVRPFEEIQSDLINRLIVGESVNLREELARGFSTHLVKTSISAFFKSFAINDLFFDLQEISDNQRILDKQEFYLYFCDIQFNRHTYPIFFVPLFLSKQEDTFVISFDSSVYVNKKALQYIVQEYNKEKGTTGSLELISERILYPQEKEDGFLSKLQAILNEAIDHFQLSASIDLTESKRQATPSLSVALSNACHLCIFDKSDEALVNDYEELLSLLKMGELSLGNLFSNIVSNFITDEPESYSTQIEDEWQDMDPSLRLVYPSPIPLNSEQRQILLALRNNRCHYVGVQGPPGTGKSHTITAIAFESIIRGQSVLILSDKKEALDVVEDKITQTLNQVRMSDQFQNPLLRLGRSGNTYSKILSSESIDKIKNSYRAVRNNLSSVKEKSVRLQQTLRQNLATTIEVYGRISLEDIHRLHILEEKHAVHPLPVDFEELTATDDALQLILDTQKNIAALHCLFENEGRPTKLAALFKKYWFDDPTIDDLTAFLEMLAFSGELCSQIPALRTNARLLHSVSESDAEKLSELLTEYSQLRSVFFGYLFKGKQIKALNQRLCKQLSFARAMDLNVHSEELNDLAQVFTHASDAKDRFSLPKNCDFLSMLHKLICHRNDLTQDLDLAIAVRLKKAVTDLRNYLPKSALMLQITDWQIATILKSLIFSLPENDLSEIKERVTLATGLEDQFAAIPRFSYKQDLSRLEELTTHQMTYLMDERVINFYENNRSTAQTLRNIIRKKKRFPRDEFVKLKEAFPCIIANIRDYSEYIPLESDLFDLAIIDEASQVSIAQAFPVLLRAKKVVVFGDKKQFSNVKSAHARSDTNREYLTRLRTSFGRVVSTDAAQLERLTKFDIKTSILEFFDFIANYNIMLLKHFRGYRELISYSSKYFYQGSLQAIKIRGSAIEDVLKFNYVEHSGEKEIAENINSAEMEFIVDQLETMKASECKQSVGIITPHTNQQKFISAQLAKHHDRDYFYDTLRLKVMTFDTCQGEERDIVFYSMVARKWDDKLWAIFAKDLQKLDLDDVGKIRAQRLNVGFSRAKECIHFVLSKPIEEFGGAIGEALRHYRQVLEKGSERPTEEDVDPKSPMERKVLQWITNTSFFQTNESHIELRAQFSVGDYLKQLNQFYTHPRYRTDFLLIYKNDENRQINIIIEYDGFKEHFTNLEEVNEFNYEHYYTTEDIEREKVLESYGYQFIRINRFNAGSDPVSTLDQRLSDLVKKKSKDDLTKITTRILDTVSGLEDGRLRECPKCHKLRPLDLFRDASLSTGMGRICRQCKPKPQKRRQSTSRPTGGPGPCPKCGSSMILRSGQYGNFFGCSRFPNCRGTRSHR